MTNKLTEDSEGVYLVTTRSGSKYTVDFERKVAVRWNPDIPIASYDGSEVPVNGEAMPWTFFRDVEIGEHLYIEMYDQWVASTEVIEIKKVG